MSPLVESYPELNRPDVGVALASTWKVGDPARQRAAVEAIHSIWTTRPWPLPDLISYSVFSSTNGDTLLHYSQWRTEEAAQNRLAGDELTARRLKIDAAVPGIERFGAHPYRPYREARRPAVNGQPGCYVAVRIEFDGPDARRQREWVDGVFSAASTEQRPLGLIGALFHLSLDGRRVLNLAEWTTERAHQDMVDKPPSSVRDAAQGFPGVTSIGFERYQLSCHFA